MLRGRKLRIWALAMGGESEVLRFFKAQRQHDPRLHDRLTQILWHIADQGESAAGQWLKQLVVWPHQWEIRQSRHRLMGFRSGQDLILCLYRLKQGQDPAKLDLQKVDRLRREWSEQNET